MFNYTFNISFVNKINDDTGYSQYLDSSLIKEVVLGSNSISYDYIKDIDVYYFEVTEEGIYNFYASAGDITIDIKDNEGNSINLTKHSYRDIDANLEVGVYYIYIKWTGFNLGKHNLTITKE